MSGPPELAPGAEFAGYRIESALGHGGMAVVYLAEHLGLERKVAIKVLAPAYAEDERFRERFVRESRLAASLDHPNVIPIYEAGESGGRLFIAMRYVEGTDLKGLIREFGPLDPAAAVPILRQVAGALDAAHAKGLVHRDVKPANVLIARTAAGETAGAHVYLSDFGLTRRTSSDSGLTGTGQFMGTLDYAAPEQFEGKPTDARTDVYALGCVLVEMLTGHPPYTAEFDAALMFAHISEPPPRLTLDHPELPAAIDDVVATAMAKSPDDRYPTAGALANAAAGAFGFQAEPSVASPATRGRRTARRATPRPGSASPGLPARRRRRGVAIAAVALVVVIALVAFLLPSLLGGSGGQAHAATPAGMTLLSAKTGAQRAFVPLSKVRSPAEVEYANGTYWVLNLDPLQFVPISEATGKVGQPINSPFDDVGYYGIADGLLYVTQHAGNQVAIVDLAHGRLEQTFTIEPERYGLAWPIAVGDELWVGSTDGFVYVLDRGTGKLLKTLGPLASSYALAYGEGAVWAATGDKLTRIDPKTRLATTTSSPPGTGYLAVGGGYVWTADETKGVVYKVAPTGALVDTIRTGDGARVVSFDGAGDALWVANQDAGTVTSIDALTGKRRSFAFEHPLQSLAVGNGTVLVQLNAGRTYEDRIDALRGDVARLFVQPYQLQGDTATDWNFLAFEVAAATCAPLLSRSDAEGAAGAALRPEVASKVETLEGGRVYRFTIHDGFRFSPPSNQPVTAETYKFSIERALGPRLGDQTPGPLFVGDIEGEQAFRDGKADHISGLVADGDTLTVTLTAPSADFLERISMPFFCPVPTDSALVANGVATPLPGPAGRQTTPGAGPYYLADTFGGEYDILERNPNYGGTRRAGFDAIALREGVDPQEAVARVRNGSFDGIIQLYDPLLAPDGPVARAFGGDAPAGGPTYRADPLGLFTSYLVFNAGKPPFDDPTIRRAAALALDRPAIAAAYGGGYPNGFLPDAGWVAPNFPGLPDPPFPSDGPDLDAARALMAGRHVSAVMATSAGCDECRQAEGAIIDQLALIGIDVTARDEAAPYQAIQDHPTRFDLHLGGSNPDFPDLASYLPVLFGTYIPNAWLPHGVVHGVAALGNTTGPDRERQALDLLAGPVTDEVPITGVGDWVTGSLLSPKLGCRVFPPFGYGLDLTALCPTGGNPTSSPSS